MNSRIIELRLTLVCAVIALAILISACQGSTPAPLPVTPPAQSGNLFPSPLPPLATASFPTPLPPQTYVPPPPAPTPNSKLLTFATPSHDLNLHGQFVFAPGDGSVWLQEASGGEPHVLVKDSTETYAESPVLSPDGKQVAFGLSLLKADGSVQTEIHVINVDGTNPRAVVTSQNPKVSFHSPAWSADGQELYFVRIDASVPSGEHSEIDRIKIDGVVSSQVVDGGIYVSVSPDAKKIIFLHFDFKTFTSSLWIAGIDGSSAKQVIDDATFLSILAPRFSPDGQNILFAASSPPEKKLPGVSYDDQHLNDSCALRFLSFCLVEKAYADGLPWDLWLVNLDGTKFQQVTDLGVDSPYAAWSPDGKFIAFFVFSGIYVIDRDQKLLYQINKVGGHGGFDWR